MAIAWRNPTAAPESFTGTCLRASWVKSDLAGSLKSEHVFFAGKRVARKDFSASTTSVSYYFSHHLKTASVITNAASTITEDEDYYPWGGELQIVNCDSNHYKFTGKERDAETGLDYFGARYYSNVLGRWVSADWSAVPVPVPYADLTDPQTLNLYGYVRGLPTTKADLDGHGWWEKLKNSFGDADCWCEGKEAEEAAKKNRENRERIERQQQEIRQAFIKEYGYDPQLVAGMLALGVAGVYADLNGGFDEETSTQGEAEESESAELQPYEEGGGHHVPAKSAFRGATGYDANRALAIPNAELKRLGISHTNVTTAQMEMYKALSQSGSKLTWQGVEKIETQALVRGGMSESMARQTVQGAIAALKNAGVSGPTRIPWGGK